MKKYSWTKHVVLIALLLAGLFYFLSASQNHGDWRTNIQQSVVGITSKDWVNDQAVIQKQGTGFMISPDGLMVTSAHALGNQRASYQVLFEDGSRLAADKVFENTEQDIAFLQLVNQDAMVHFLKPSDNDLNAGDGVYTAYFDHSKGNVILKKGLINNILSDDLIKSDLIIPHGGSGGPLLSDAGEVIGLNVGIGKVDDESTFSKSWKNIDLFHKKLYK